VDRARKEELVASMHQTFQQAATVVVTHYSGMTVAQMEDLREKMHENGARFQVTRNRLARRAIAGTKYETLATLFDGPTAIAYSDDPLSAAKVTVTYSKTNEKLTVLGGAMGEIVLDESAVKALAALPSLEELRGKIVTLLITPASRIVGVLSAPAGQLARAIEARGKQSDAE
jgi:large subunit ribosomal protein L10